MPEDSTPPDLVELTPASFEVMDRDWDIDALAPRVNGKLARITSYLDIDEAPIAAESLAEERG